MGDTAADRAEAQRAVLLDHYRHPRHHGLPDDIQIVRRGANARCGDVVDVGVSVDGETLRQVAFRGHGCSLCIASASLMTEAVTGRRRSEALRLCALLRDWLERADADMALPEALAALAPVRRQSARRLCVLLAWNALESALADAGNVAPRS
jgi:nitrogen fixation protein NifU and related proteins